MSKFFCSFSVGFDSASYGPFYFVKSPIKTEHNKLGFDWLTWLGLTDSHFVFLWGSTYNCPSKQILISILTDSVITSIILLYIYTVLDIKSKHYKWNAVKLSTEAVVRRYSSR